MSPPPTLLLYGGRRTGKTSTLKYLPEKVGADLIPLRIDCQGVADALTLQGVAKSMVQQMTDSARINRRLTLPNINHEALKDEPFLTLRNWFTRIEKIAPQKRFLLCLDEFERLQEVVDNTNSRAPLNFLRYIIQDYPRWILLFSGSHNLDEIADYWSDYLINTRYVRISYLEKSDAEDLIINPIPNFPAIYHPQTVARIIYWTRCQPYLVQLVCLELVDYLNRIHQQNALNVKATPEDVEQVIPKALITATPYFDEFWRKTLNEPQRESLRCLVKEKQPTKTDEIMWKKLIAKEILQVNKQGKLIFQVPLIQRSVTEKIAMEI